MKRRFDGLSQQLDDLAIGERPFKKVFLLQHFPSDSLGNVQDRLADHLVDQRIDQRIDQDADQEVQMDNQLETKEDAQVDLETDLDEALFSQIPQILLNPRTPTIPIQWYTARSISQHIVP